MNVGLALIFSIVCAVVCGYIADSKGRNAIGWGALGFFITWIAVIIVLLVGDLNEPRVVYREREVIVPAEAVVTIDPSARLKNHTVGPNEDLQIVDITLYERSDHHAISLRAKVGQKDIKCLKLDLDIVDIFGEAISVSKLILDFIEPSKSNWQSSEESRLLLQDQISLEHAKYVTVQPAHIIWSDDSLEACIVSWKVMDEEELKSAENVTEDLILRLSDCTQISEAKEIVEEYRPLLIPDLSCALDERIDKDIYIKRMYGGKEDLQKIQKYIQMIEEKS